jgi:hypothetical protein
MNSQASASVKWQSTDRAIVEKNLSRFVGNQTGHQEEGCRLACSVRAQQSNHLPTRDTQRNAIHDTTLSIASDQILNS